MAEQISDISKIKSALNVAYGDYRMAPCRAKVNADEGWHDCHIAEGAFYRAGAENAMPSILEWEGFGLLGGKDVNWITCIVRLRKA